MPKEHVKSGFREGTVVAVGGGGLCRVQSDDAELICSVRGRLRRDGSGRVVVGDRVAVTVCGDGRGIIEDVRPRGATWTRADVFKPREQTVAVNVDLAVIVLAVRDPAFNVQTAERYVVQARSDGLEAVVCVNKADLWDSLPPAEARRVEEGLADLLRAGVPAVLASAASGLGLAEVERLMAGRRAVIIGPSGVGKSSLLNAVRPGLALGTGAVSTATHKGRHTTTAATAVGLATGFAIDTPGQRAIGLWGVGEDEVAGSFPEFAPYADGCRFRDCSHVHEPGCAVRAAVERGEIDHRRYRHYVRLRRNSGRR